VRAVFSELAIDEFGLILLSTSILTGLFGIPRARNKLISGSYTALQAPPNPGPFNYHHMSLSR
jgi:hypothetical protein